MPTRPGVRPDTAKPMPGESSRDYIARRYDDEHHRYREGAEKAAKLGFNVVRDYDDLPPVPEGKTRIYHGTWVGHLEAIKKEGLQTGRKTGIGERTGFVLATTSPQDPLGGPYYGRPTVIVADIPTTKQVNDKQNIVDLQAVAPDAIVGVYVPEVMPYLEKQGVPLDDMLRYNREFEQRRDYDGMPQAIIGEIDFTPIINDIRKELPKATGIEVGGSFARGELKPKSDIDIIIQLPAGTDQFAASSALDPLFKKYRNGINGRVVDFISHVQGSQSFVGQHSQRIESGLKTPKQLLWGEAYDERDEVAAYLKRIKDASDTLKQTKKDS